MICAMTRKPSTTKLKQLIRCRVTNKDVVSVTKGRLVRYFKLSFNHLKWMYINKGPMRAMYGTVESDIQSKAEK